ncbi:MAG: cell division topological specificity factor MinE [Chloroflexi bacterium]|nr:cell division topological specificity factor MinE [Chloroflexota bacterium]
MNILDRLFGRREPSSSAIAKERLQLVLVHDRVKLSPELMETLKSEIIAVISRHVTIDEQSMEIKLTSGRGYQKLTADIPIVGPRDAAPKRKRK